ncbi:hypothetical protein CCH79_00006269 [Gambusia affinis]|uniref:Ig-like domain-containing protein n=1 Tax=Gambusia affinis TaxID=33528 RepID=A0A315VZY6_GAMAF|nr:hypothetical protein CCH79_00006269 [Gambusia affinis]
MQHSGLAREGGSLALNNTGTQTDLVMEKSGCGGYFDIALDVLTTGCWLTVTGSNSKSLADPHSSSLKLSKAYLLRYTSCMLSVVYASYSPSPLIFPVHCSSSLHLSSAAPPSSSLFSARCSMYVSVCEPAEPLGGLLLLPNLLINIHVRQMDGSSVDGEGRYGGMGCGGRVSSRMVSGEAGGHSYLVACWQPILILMLGTVLSGSTTGCPSKCDCNGQERSVVCHRRRLAALPEGIPTETRLLDLSKNRLKTLGPEEFINYPQLEELQLNENTISSIEPGAFSNLMNLRTLGLRNNELKLIQLGVFTGLTNLTQLDISENKIVILLDYMFQELYNLRALEVGDNDLAFHLAGGQLVAIEPYSFRGLNHLRILNVSRNSLSTLEESVFHSVGNLETLALYENPLACDCRLLWVFRRRWRLNFNKQQPICASPKIVQGKEFKDFPDVLPPDYFICQKSKIVDYKVVESHVDEGTTVHFTCIAEGDPAPVIMWLSPKKEYITTKTIGSRLSVSSEGTLEAYHRKKLSANMFEGIFALQKGYGDVVQWFLVQCHHRQEGEQITGERGRNIKCIDILQVNMVDHKAPRSAETAPLPIGCLEVAGATPHWISRAWQANQMLMSLTCSFKRLLKHFSSGAARAISGSLREGSRLIQGTEISLFLDENMCAWQKELSFLKIKKPVLNFKPHYATAVAVRVVECLWLALSCFCLSQGFISYHFNLSFCGKRKSEVYSEEQECNPQALTPAMAMKSLQKDADISHLSSSHPLYVFPGVWHDAQLRKKEKQNKTMIKLSLAIPQEPKTNHQVLTGKVPQISCHHMDDTRLLLKCAPGELVSSPLDYLSQVQPCSWQMTEQLAARSAPPGDSTPG